MNGLLRIHFASIGHKDARLAPLTLDLADGALPADSVLWLRNGGGKSSILNLFYSVFRPDRREFLGAHAEGRTRRLEDYVQGGDLAFVLTEWRLDPPGLLPGLAAPTTLVAGQCLSWKGQQRSSDPANLRQLFFTLRTGPGLNFEELPIEGLGPDPARSWEAFRDWLNELGRGRPQAEVVHETAKGRWQEHLERVLLDPELFRYQLRMNQREGAADEQFRFASAEDFVRFFLELAMDTSHADRVSASLDELRDQLERRPALELERRFLAAAHGALLPLVEAVARQEEAQAAFQAVVDEAATLRSGLEETARRHEVLAVAAEAEAAQAEETRRRTENARDLRQRWARGLEGRARELLVEEVIAEEQRASALRDQAQQRERLARAGQQRARVDALEARHSALQAELAREQAEREPLRLAFARAGGMLSMVLDQQITSLRLVSARATDRAAGLDREIEHAAAEHKAMVERRGHLLATIGQLKDRLSDRDRRREKLRQEGLLADREEVLSAITRVAEAEATTLAREEGANGRIAALRAEQAAQAERLTTATRDQASHAKDAEGLGRELRQVQAEAERLRAHPRLREVEEVDRVDLSAESLEARVRGAAEARQQRVLGLQVDGAEDARALASVARTGLLPPSVDVERLLDVLGEHDIPAFAGPHWLAENLPAGDRQAAVLQDPARFAGVIVHDAGSLERLDRLATDRLGLRGPVQVSVASPPAAATERPHRVLPPASEGAWDQAAAATVRTEAEARSARREREAQELTRARQELEAVAADLHRFLSRWGQGELDRLDQRHRAALAQADEAAARMAETRAARDRLGADIQAAEQELQLLRQQLSDLQRGRDRLEAFQEQVERHASGWREELARGNAESEQLGLAMGLLEARLTQLRGEAESQRAQAHEQERLAREHEGERAAITLRDEPGPAPLVGLDAARAAWRTRKAAWEGALSESRVQGQLDELVRTLAEARKALSSAARGLSESEVRGAAVQGESAALARAESARAEVEAAVTEVGRCQGRVEEARRRLAELGLRREADDLPTVEDPPTTAAEALARAEHWKAQAESLRIEAEEASRRLAADTERARRLRAAIAHRGTQRELLEATTGPLPPAPPEALPDEDGEVAHRVKTVQVAFKAAQKRATEAVDQARGRAEAVRSVAHDERFSEHLSQVRTRLRDEADELIARAPRHAEEIGRRLDILDRQLQELAEHQRLIVRALDGVAAEAISLLERAGRASELPETMGAWAGRPFLQIRVQRPATEAEREARLGGLVQRIVAQAQMPRGLDLARLATLELAGSAGIDVTVLKPDTTLRPDRIPIAAMSTFSRGQQLTAAVLLYCTLVQLRARSRGRGRGSHDAGVLILDNPIGTCSSVPLLDLQRTVARQMRVQLVYTTGVHDLDALSTLPNVVRLRNTHRDRRSGDHHVTHDQVEAVRVLAAEAS